MQTSLPQLSGDRLFLTDGGLETVLSSTRASTCPQFASFPLLEDEHGRAALREYFERFLELARERDAGFVLDTATWRANPDWARCSAMTPSALDRVNREAVAFAQELRDEHAGADAPVLVNGVIGPRGDGYMAANLMSAEEARGVPRRPGRARSPRPAPTWSPRSR